MYKTIGILAHVDAGKTTLSEQILYKCNVVRKLGRVDHGDALLDSDVMERRRGITVFSDVASFDIGDDKYFLIDTPGHMDFQAECERVLPVLDYAILVVSAVEMVQAHTENLFYLLREYKIPAFVFINKVDREGADASKTFADIKEKLVGDTTFIETSGITLGKSNNDVDNIQNMHNSLNIEQADFTEVVLDEQTIETISDFDEDIMQDRYNTTISFSKGDIIYRESICASTGGYGHYEPLRHYAEVHLRLEPTPNGSGISFRSECPLDILSKNWQNLIRTHIFEKQHIGALVGAELTDIEFVLTTGRDHLKHTEGGDFREATYRAIRQAARTSKHAGTTMLLEPFYNYDIQADASLINRIISDIQKMCGTYDNTEIVGDYCFIRGVIPVSTSQNYYDEFMALSKGRGRLKLKYGGYMECHNTEEVVKDMAYDADRDIENTANSIFCSHGAGYEVKWQDAKHMMHIQED